MTLTPLTILLLDQGGETADAVEAEFRGRGQNVVWRRIETESSLPGLLRAGADLILTDPGSTPVSMPRLFELLKETGSEIPVLLVCDSREEPIALAALELGGADYIFKDRLSRLAWAIRRALEQRQYRSIVEGALEGVVIHQNGIIRFANRSAALLAGYERPSEIIGLNMWETFVSPEARADLQARCAACLRGEKQPMHTGWRGIRKDGARLWVQSSVNVITWKGEKALMGYFSDITERKRAEESIRESEERFRQLAENISTVFWITDPLNTNTFYVSPAYEVVWGRTRASLYASPQSWFDALHPEDKQRIDPAQLRKGVHDYVYRIVRPDGTIRWIRDRAFPVRNASGEVHRVAGVAEDITEQRHLEEQLRQAQKMEAIGQLAGGVAHDFNNLLTIIHGHVAVVKDPSSTPESIREAAQQISLAADRAAGLTRQLLTFSRRQLMQPRDLDLNEVIDQTGKMLQRVLGEDIELALKLSPNLPRVHADPGMVEQVLLNMAVNARDAMSKGGRLEITTSSRVVNDASDARTLEMAPGLAVCVAVKDTGCGIPRQNLGRIFEPFFTTKDVGKGTGLGLASAYGIIKQHKGCIRVMSEVNHGSTFEILIPARIGTGARPSSPVPEPVLGGSEGILLVEDEPTLRVLVRAVLVRYGYRVFEAQSGPNALEIWRQHKEAIDLVLTDMVMPDGMSGRELAEELKRERPKLKIVFSSGYSQQVVAQGLVVQPGVNFLSKPYDPQLLARTVRACLDAPTASHA